MADVPAAVELRRGRDEVELRRRRRSGRRRRGRRRARASGASFIPPPCQRPLATITSCIGPRRSPPSKRDRHLGVLPREELADERVVERRPAAERLRHRVRARARRRRSSRPSRRWRRSASPRRRPASRNVDAAEVDPSRRRRSSATRTASSKRVGMPCVRPKSWPVPVGQHGELGAGAGDAVHDLVQRPVAADDDEQLARRAAASRASSVRWPGPLREQRLAVEPELRAPAARSFGQRFAGRAVRARRVDEEDGPLAHAASRASRGVSTRDVEREPRHPVDGGPQLLVGDPRERRPRRRCR